MTEPGAFSFSVDRGKRQKGRAALWSESEGELREARGAAIDLGGDPACSVVLGDPVVAERHARVSLRDGRFWIEDLESATGTYRNGLPVDSAQALEHGDELVLGTTRIEVRLRGTNQEPLRTDDGRPLLVLVPQEGKFAFVPKSSKLFKEENQKGVQAKEDEAKEPRDEPAPAEERDPVAALATKDQWVYAETRFGKSRGLLVANWLAVGLAVLLPFSLFTVRGKELNNPGEISATHQEAMRADGQGCAVCHAAFDGPTVDRCGNCHAPLLEPQRHPFGKGRAVAFALAGGECEVCHREHQGPKLAVPEPTASCTASGCHSAAEMEPAAIEASLAARKVAGRESQPRPMRVGYNEFSHESHLKESLRIECGACHVAGATGEREFLPVEFERCMTCHGAEGAETARRSWPESDPELFGWDVAWHGSEDLAKCAQCHEPEQVREGVLRLERTPDHDALAFRLARRDHGKEFPHVRLTVASDELACADCHRQGTIAPAEGVGVPFWHGLHLEALAPAASARKALSEECQKCHTDVAVASTLASIAAPGSLTAPTPHCATCHEDAAGQPLPLVVVAPPAVRARERPDFPHAAHLELEGGCFECHSFDPAGEPRLALPVTAADPACTTCHANHAAIGGGECARCHGFEERWSIDPAAPRRFSAWRDDGLWKDWRNGGRVERTAEPTPKTGKSASAFQHFSPGHKDSTEAGDCLACHAGPTGAELRSAKNVLEVPIPQETEPGCRKCHVTQRQRFHWE